MQGDISDDYPGGSADPPAAPTTTRRTGPVTDPNDPRLSDPTYASDPDVLKFLNGIYGPGGTAFNPTPGTPGWNPQTQAWIPGTATDTTTGGGGGTYGQGGGSNFAFPTFTPPVYTPGAPFTPGQFAAPPAFSYKDFSAPTLADAQNAPGYQFAVSEGRKALENSAAARGVLRTGGTLKDLFSWGDKFAEQNYGNVFNQASQTYGTNRNNAADTYRTNYGISKDVFDTNYGASKDAWSMNNQSGLDTFDRLYRGSVDAFNPSFQAASLKFSDLYNRDRDKLNALTQLSGYGV